MNGPVFEEKITRKDKKRYPLLGVLPVQFYSQEAMPSFFASAGRMKYNIL